MVGVRFGELDLDLEEVEVTEELEMEESDVEEYVELLELVEEAEVVLEERVLPVVTELPEVTRSRFLSCFTGLDVFLAAFSLALGDEGTVISFTIGTQGFRPIALGSFSE